MPYDGSNSTISLYDAGSWTPDELKTYPIENYKNSHMSCVLQSSNGGETTVAMAQVQPPATDIYINTHVLNYLTQGTILHEALHNLTGKNDPQLKTMLDLPLGQSATDDINHKLEGAGCAGTN